MASLAAMFNAADKSTPEVAGEKGPAALEVAAKMKTWAKLQGIQVIHGLIDIDAKPFPSCKGADRLASIGAAMKSSGGEEPVELLGGRGDDVTFTRRPGYVSALKSPGLDDFLQKKGIKSLVLAGLSKSGCVLRTAITASDAEYVVSVISDGCADPVEGMHDMIVGKLLNNRGYVTTGAEFQEGFAKATSGK